MSSARRVRKTPLAERVKSYLDPWDFLLWLSEEVNSNELQESIAPWSTAIGAGANVLYMVARANVGSSPSRRDDVFGDYHERGGSGWLAWCASFVVHLLSLSCFLNAFYTFFRRRHYRFFEASVDVTPLSSSARRVRVDSSPVASSPLRYLSNILHVSTADDRAHPDSSRDVWELAVWDPTPLCLRLFCLFSPGHVLVYWLFLPLRPLDPQPSVTVVTTLVLAALLSAQLMLLQTFSLQQSKDAALLHKEVQHEYDAKFVHPSLNKPVRDVGTQVIPRRWVGTIPEVNTYTPTTFVNRGFKTNPNPSYSPHYDPDGNTTQQNHLSRSVTTPNIHSVSTATDYSSPLKPTPTPAMRPPQFRSSGAGLSSGDGGSFGIYNHAQSPLRKQVSAQALRERSPAKREGSPLKKSNIPTVFGADGRPVRTTDSHLRGGGLRRESGRF